MSPWQQGNLHLVMRIMWYDQELQNRHQMYLMASCFFTIKNDFYDTKDRYSTQLMWYVYVLICQVGQFDWWVCRCGSQQQSHRDYLVLKFLHVFGHHSSKLATGGRVSQWDVGPQLGLTKTTIAQCIGASKGVIMKQVTRLNSLTGQEVRSGSKNGQSSDLTSQDNVQTYNYSCSNSKT